MKVILTIFAVAVLAADGKTQVLTSKAPSSSPLDIKEWNSQQGKWIPDPDAPGTYSMMATGDPAEGPAVRYVKFDPGASIGWHWHPAPEMVFGERGKLEYQILNSGRRVIITSGSYASFPEHSIHKGTCVSKEPCMFYLQNLVRTAKHMVDENGNEIKTSAPPSDNNPRVGTWKLNVPKSTFHDGPPPESEIQICEASDTETLRLKIVRVDASGKEIRSEYTANYDGADHPFPGSLWDTIALKRLDRNTSEAVFKKSGNTVQTSTVSVSRDGQVLTLTARATGVPGQPISHIEVFDRQ